MVTPQISGNDFSQIPLSGILSAAAKIDGVDIALALNRISGKQNVLEESIERTAYSIDEKVKKMDACLRGGDLHRFSIEAHGLKSAFICIGAVKYFRLAAELETASKDGDFSLCEEKFAPFSDLIRSFADELKSAFPQTEIKERAEGSNELLLKVLKETADSLGAFEADDALACMTRLDGFWFGEETEAILNQIKNMIKGFKYDEALRVLESILG